MDDDAFLIALEEARLPNAALRHADHIRAAYLYLQRFGYPDAVAATVATIRRFAAAHGTPQAFHFTLTVAWTRCIAAHWRNSSAATPFGTFLAANRELLDPTLPMHFYTRERLFAAAARVGWQTPDLRSLPPVPGGCRGFPDRDSARTAERYGPDEVES